MELLIKLVFCHLLGDYTLQNGFIAETKGSNWYHLFIHCGLYCLPFYICFGYGWQLGVIFVSHFAVDALKARFKRINYLQDQVIHYLILLIYLIRI